MDGRVAQGVDEGKLGGLGVKSDLMCDGRACAKWDFHEHRRELKKNYTLVYKRML